MIIFTDEPGCSNVVCFTVMASIILSEQWYKDRKDNFNDERVRIITTGKFNQNKIICIRYETNVYPSTADSAEFLPPALKLFMNCSSETRFKISIVGRM